MSWLESLRASLPKKKKKRRETLDFMGWDDVTDDDDDEVDAAPQKKKKEREPDHVILYIRTADHQLWGHYRSGWKLLTTPPKGHVIVMVNLAEESFEQITTPRLFGRDRTSFLNRQLSNRFPETPYRAALDGTPPGKVLEKLAPTRHILVGLEAQQRIQKEIAAHDYSVRGVWTVSVLMAQYGTSLFLPEDLFIVFLGPGGQRIVYIKDRVPVLTRLTPNSYKAASQVDEIVRTLRYLENKQLVERGTKRHSLLLLGDPTELEAPLREARFDLVERDKWEDQFPEDWRFPLFDRVIKNPPGQLAPLLQRTRYLADKINRYAINVRLVAIALTVALVAGLLPSTLDRYERLEDSEVQIEAAAAKVAETNRKIGELGVTPDLMRRALDLNEKEVTSVPEMEEHFIQLASVIANYPDLRLSRLGWRMLASGAAPCQNLGGDSSSAGSTQAQIPDPTQDPNQPSRMVELVFELELPETYGPRQRLDTLKKISSGVTKVGGRLVRDPSADVSRGALRGGSTVTAEKGLVWCATLPGVKARPPAPDEVKA